MSNKSGSVLLAFLIGGVVGASLAILLAPESGEETRRRIVDGVEGAGDWAKDRYSDTRDRVADGADKVRQIIDDRRDDLSAALEAGKDAYARGKEKLMKEV